MNPHEQFKPRRRAEVAAELIGEAARQAPAGTRLGSRDDLRAMSGVSVGTLHEALRLLQATGEIVVRPGPGGGVFAGEKSALAAMLRDVHHLSTADQSFWQVARVLDALVPLFLQDAIASLDDAGTQRLRDAFAGLTAATNADLRGFVRASLEVFATVATLAPTGVLTVMVAALLRTQIAGLQGADLPIDLEWRDAVDRHTAAVARLIDALVGRDLDAALDACRNPDFMGVFAALAQARSGGHTTSD